MCLPLSHVTCMPTCVTHFRYTLSESPYSRSLRLFLHYFFIFCTNSVKPTSAKPKPKVAPSPTPSMAEMRAFMQYDQDQNQSLDFNEFMAMMAPEIRQKHSVAEIQSWFNAIDKDNNGTVSPNEFFAMAGSLGLR